MQYGQTAGQPVYSDYAGALYKSFFAYRLRRPSIVWLNERFFLEKGFDVSEPEKKSSVEAWLLREFAFAVPQIHDQSAAYDAVQKAFFADRYGGHGITTHGGSGRCGTLGAFQVKGIGITPLVGQGADEFHSHGSVTLEEAIREVVYAELAHFEAPAGAIPILAIIETGTRTHWNERKALIVRSTFFRASFLERAAMHRPSNLAEQDYLVDAERVRQMVLLVTSKETRARAKIGSNNILDFVDRVASQIAFSHVARLYFGPFSTSNLAINGKVFDFGSARAMPGWAGTVTVRGAPPFGKLDLQLFAMGCEDIVFFVKKYSKDISWLGNDADLNSYIGERYKFYFNQEILRLFGINAKYSSTKIVNTISCELGTYFDIRQKIRLSLFEDDILGREKWIVKNGNYVPAEALSLESKTVSVIKKAILDEQNDGFIEKGDAQLLLSTARQKLSPRVELYRETLQKLIYSTVVEADGDGGSSRQIAARATRLICRAVSAGLRYFPFFEERFLVLGCATDLISIALYCRRPNTEMKVMMLLGGVCGGKQIFFGARIDNQNLHEKQKEERCNWIELSLPNRYEGEDTVVNIYGTAVNVPKMSMFAQV